MSTISDERLVVVDTETTGLNFPGDDVPLEYGVAIYRLSDWKLVDGFQCLIWSPYHDLKFDKLSDVVAAMHRKSGLLDECMDEALDIEDAERALVKFLKEWDVSREDPMVGSSVQFDRTVLHEHAPKAEELFHYRNIDTSTIKELCRRFNPQVYAKLPESRKMHRVMSDIEDTVNELRFYIDNFCFDGRPVQTEELWPGDN